MENSKAISKTVSLRPEQITRVGKIIDIKRHGQFSQFVQDSIDEKLDKLGFGKPEPEAQAS